MKNTFFVCIAGGILGYIFGYRDAIKTLVEQARIDASIDPVIAKELNRKTTAEVLVHSDYWLWLKPCLVMLVFGLALIILIELAAWIRKRFQMLEKHKCGIR
jgi:hypothetical protein